MIRAILSRACLTAAALTVVAGPAAAQTVDELVARHIAARGGMDKLKAIQTLKITRTVGTGIGNNVKVIVYKKRPSLYRGEQGPATAGATLVPRGINESDAWDTVQGKIVTRPEPAEAETRDLDGDFDGLLVDWKEKGHTVTFDGREKLSTGEALKLKVKLKSGGERVVYLDASTYLERRQTGTLSLLNGRKVNSVIDYSNWRDVNGVKFPFDITEDRTGDMPAQSFVVYTEKIEANVPMDDALFATPKGQ
jgi:hypothetical protein